MNEDPRLVQLKVPPHSEPAEQSLLGALLLDNQAFERVADLVTAEDFYRDDHRRIFRHISRLVEQNRPADLVTLPAAIEASEDRDKAGGVLYLAKLAEATPTALNIRRYAEIVREKSVRRQIAQLMTEGAERALSDGQEDVRELIEWAESQVLGIGRDPGGAGSGPVHIGKAAVEWVEWVDEHPNGIETGLKDFDALSGGFQPGNLIIIAGRTHMGKTSLALQFAEHICTDKPGMVFSLEATRREVAGRLVEWHRNRIGRDAAMDKVFKLNMFIDETSGITPAAMRSRLRRHKREHGLSLVVVDYLQLVRGKGDTREQEVAFISRELKGIAKEFEVPVIALSQLSRKVEERADKRPHMADMRESGAIEQDADLIAMLYRPDYYDAKFDGSMAEAEILVPKNRNTGRTGLVKVMFSRDMGRFGDYLPERYRAGAA